MTKAAFDPVAGEPMVLAPDLCLVLAPNPSPMTYLGTNTYILGVDTVAVIDPGPASDAHLASLLAAIDGRPVSHIIVTHSHLDHSPLARILANKTNAPVLAFGDSHAGRSPIMQNLSLAGYSGGGEGMDWDFTPDHILTDGATLIVAGKRMQAIHTPGHIGNHLCLLWGDVMFSGDHVMGWATSLVSPPDGDMTDFLSSCMRLQSIQAQTYYPGHGAPVADPAARLVALIAHRKTREAQIRTALGTDNHTVASLTKAIYSDIPPTLYAAAQRNVFAHLVDLHQRHIVTAKPTLSQNAIFALFAPI